jgi:AbrB family looped-hinge helix DNA binding protein
MSMKRLKISRGGQISLPAPIRHRWNGSTVTLEDRDDHVILRPAPDDPIAAARGALADLFAGVTSEDLRRAGREEDAEIEERRVRGE